MATATVAARFAARRLTASCSDSPASSVGGRIGSISRELSSLSLALTRSRSASATALAPLPSSSPLVPIGGSLSGLRRRGGHNDVTGVRCFSTRPDLANDDGADEDDAPEDDPNVLAWPRNLTISRGATSSPFHGLSKVGEVGEMEEVDMEADEAEGEEGEVAAAEAEEGEAAAAEAEEDDDEDEDEYDPGDWDEDEDDEEEEEFYDLSTRPEPYRAIPLPDRLHVPVYELYVPNHAKVEPVGTIHLDPLIFGLDPIRVDLIHKVVRYQRNKKRGKRYPAKTKTISEVRGSGRKVRQQKGLGRARAGHRRPAHWRGGAKAHGPKGIAQDYTTRLNKKMRKAGLRHILSQKLKEGNLVLMSDLRAESHKTKYLARALKRHGIAGDRGSPAFMVDNAEDDDDDGEGGEEDVRSVGGVDINFKVASGNIRKIRLVNHLGANVYDIINHKKLVLSLAAVTALEKRLMP